MGAQPAAERDFIPALGRFGSRFYDPIIRTTMRERRFRERLLELAAIGPDDRVIDVGCGTGTLAVMASARGPKQVTGVDLDEDVIHRARAKAASAGVEVDFRVGSATELPLADESADVVLTSLLFHHLERPAKETAAREMHRVLAPGGRLAFADWGPAADPLTGALFLVIRATDGFGPTADHAAGRIPEILSAAGFAEVVRADGLRTVYGSLELLTARRGR